ncbi:hypothetical protein L1264_17195 [Pseudoalteromonas sp. APAL1]|uniref:hypothetical protein n=1 Tax=Pseudoalteromonas TaxID=53246 RepID=UPI000ED5781F|nr:MULTISPECIES: hypothetical protein [unclassified Pseudoalteromonas]MCF2922210.1 hypothetical protein [Pseudoalteromonas sp. APAL1]HCV05439.1 hypothetical protein [Pseudoalteromonas sp.]
MFKFIPLKTILITSLCMSSNWVLANDIDFKLMVVDDEASSIAIMQGDYNAGLVTSAEDSANQYIAPFNRCVASVKLKQFEKAEADCTEAISLLKEIKASRFKRNELTSFALSNRGVARFMANNDTAAIADFYEASRLDDNEYVSFNLNRAKQELKLW